MMTKQLNPLTTLLGLLLGAGLLAGHPALVAKTPMPHQAPGQSVGTVNCTTSTCHGAIAPWEGSNVLQNEYTTWSRLDKHARAYAVLQNDRSKKIVQRLGLKTPATEAKICLDCHAHNAPANQRGGRFAISDGVSCEACHGPAGKWVQSHTNEGTAHAQNVANGLYPTSNPVDQARLCLSCHFGAESRPMTHRIMGAGHPRLSFEIDTFSALEPAHWRIDADWGKRKGSYDPMRIWALGQVIAVQELVDTLSDPKRGRDGLFPELVLFDCHACHHPMSEDKYSARTGVGPGRIRLNDSNMLILRAIVKAVDITDSKAFNDQVAKLHAAVAGNPEAAGADPIEEAKKLSALLNVISAKFASYSFTNADLQKVLGALVAEAVSESYSDYAGAEQAYMAITSVSSSLEKRGALPSASATNKRLLVLRKLLANDEKYKPAEFHKELINLRNLTTAQLEASR
jgi:hypothetical protein